MKNRMDTEVIEGLRHQIELPHRHAAAQDQNVVCLEVKLQSTLQLGEIVGDVIVGDSLEAVGAQLGNDGVRVGTSHLMRKYGNNADSLSSISGGDLAEASVDATHADSHFPRRPRWPLECTQAYTGANEQGALARVTTAAMDVLPRFNADALRQLSVAVLYCQLLDRDNTIAAARKHRSGHDFDATRP